MGIVIFLKQEMDLLEVLGVKMKRMEAWQCYAMKYYSC